MDDVQRVLGFVSIFWWLATFFPLLENTWTVREVAMQVYCANDFWPKKIKRCRSFASPSINVLPPLPPPPKIIDILPSHSLYNFYYISIQLNSSRLK